ncbi:MAG TPA: HNH endonuclease, partial [Amycolatopsis sp.]|nr:HNH endonuclease [Amycolatopsis sp.]
MTSDVALSSEAVALADRIVELVASMRSAEAKLGALLVEIEQRGAMELFGYRSAARLLEHLADTPKPAAERLIKRARLVNPGRNLDGSPIPALAPATGAAVLAGRLSNPMIDVITNVLTQVPPEHCASAEANLLAFAEEA